MLPHLTCPVGALLTTRDLALARNFFPGSANLSLTRGLSSQFRQKTLLYILRSILLSSVLNGKGTKMNGRIQRRETFRETSCLDVLL